MYQYICKMFQRTSKPLWIKMLYHIQLLKGQYRHDQQGRESGVLMHKWASNFHSLCSAIHWFHALLKVCSDHDDTVPLILVQELVSTHHRTLGRVFLSNLISGGGGGGEGGGGAKAFPPPLPPPFSPRPFLPAPAHVTAVQGKIKKHFGWICQ